MMNALCAASGFGPGRDPRMVAQWTVDMFLAVTLDKKDLQASGGKIVRMSALEAASRGYVMQDPRGSLLQQIAEGKVKVPDELKNTAYQIAPREPRKES